ncbi:5-oxoprolinase subunit PxpB [Lentibacillus lipolyticus]|nr:5-oxoprolinase subunit PxpB [Lentibacillus lipolyticus]
MDYDIQPIGDTGVKVTFKGEVAPSLNRTIRQFCSSLKKADIPGVVEWVPAYDSVTVYYEPHRIRFKEISKKMEDVHDKASDKEEMASRLLQVPVVYGGKYGPDLERVAMQNGLSPDDVVEIHAGEPYLVYMLGFLPGFPYLGGLDKRVATPRLDEPRGRTPAGSVGIASEQTGVYPMESPGGWNIIGQTPIRLFDPDRAHPFLFRAGDRIQFQPVTEEKFEVLKHQAANGELDLGIADDGETD